MCPRALCPVLLLLVVTALAVPASGRGREHRRAQWSVVRGLDGDPDLRLDVGRRLDGYPLLRRELRARYGVDRPARGSALWLSSVEKVRLDARRIAFASRLSPEQKLERYVAVVRHRMPQTPDSEAACQRSSECQVRRDGFTRLSEHTRGRTGMCRERSFLLKSMLDEAGLRSRVRYGVLYDHANNYLGGHAWVEAKVDGRWLLLDPSQPDAIPRARPTVVQEALANGQVRRINGLETAELLYVPTNDLSIARPGRGAQ